MNNNTVWGVLCGMAGGFIQLQVSADNLWNYFLQIHITDPALWILILKVTTTAFISGFFGMLGKSVFEKTKRWWVNRK